MEQAITVDDSLLKDIYSLPPTGRREVVDFVAFLKGKYQEAVSEDSVPVQGSTLEAAPDPKKNWDQKAFEELLAKVRAMPDSSPAWDPAKLERSRKLSHKRVGWAEGKSLVPDDFDTMMQDEIIAMFEGK